MADPNVPADQTATDQTSGGQASAQQSLDDLTVLNNVQTQNMGEARLNVMRSVDVTDAGFGALATVHQGATLTAPTIQAGVVQTGIDIPIDNTIGTASTIPEATSIATTTGTVPEVTSAPATVTATTTFTATAAATVTPTAPEAPAPAPTQAAAAPTLEAPTATTHTTTAETATTAAAPTVTLPPAPSLAVNEIQPTQVSLQVGSPMTGHENSPIDFTVNAGGLTPQISGEQHGTITYENGEYVYTPNTDFVGTDTFVVTVTDQYGRTATETVTVDVDGPVVQSNPGAADYSGHTVNGSITAVESGPGADSGTTLSYSLASGTDAAPAHGSVTVHSDGTYTYTANQGYVGTDSFQVVISDGHGGTTTQTVHVTDQSYTLTEHDQGADTTYAGHSVAGTITTSTTGFTDDTMTYSGVGTTDANGNIATAHGSVQVNSDGTYTYTANANYSGSDSFQVVVNDGHGGTATQTITVNDLANPMQVGESGGTGHGAIAGTISATDAAQDNMSYSVASQPANGTVALHADGTYSYTPNANFNWSNGATDTFTVQVSDGHGGTTTQQVVVTEQNTAPVDAAGDSSTTRLGTVTGAFTATDTDGDTLGTTAAAGHGTVTVDGQGHYTYTATDAGFIGSDTVTFTTSDGHGGSTTTTAVVNVGDDAQIHTGTTGGTGEVNITGTVAASDQYSDKMSFSFGNDASGNPITSMNTGHGTVSIDPSTGAYHYTDSNGNWQAGQTDTFSVQVSDGHGGTTTQQVVVTEADTNQIGVTATSTAAHDGATVALTTTQTDSGDTLSASVVDGPAHGTVQVNADGTYTYTDTDANWQAGNTDSFTVQVSDGHGGVATQTVTVTDADGAQINTGTTGGSGEVNITGTVAASDQYSDKMSFSFGNDASGNPITSMDTGHGTVTIDPSTGAYHYTDSNGSWQAGDTDTFSVQVSDGHGGITTQQVVVTEADTNQIGVTATSTAAHDGATVALTTTQTEAGNTLSASIVDGPAHGTVQVNADGTYTYTDTNANWQAGDTDSFTVQVSDGHGGVATQTVTVTDADTNQIGVTATSTSAHGGATVVLNTTETETGDTLTPSVVGEPAHGQVSIDSNGVLHYTDNNANWQAGDTDTFTVQVSDGHGGFATQTVTVTDRDAGTSITTGTSGGVGNGSIAGAVSASDNYHDTMSYNVTAQPQNGTVTMHADGTYTYTPNADFQWTNGSTDTFTVQVSDGHGGTVNQQVVVTEQTSGVVDVAGGASTVRLGTATGTFVVNDLDGAATTTVATANHGTVTVNADGTYTYTETDKGFTGSDTVTFTTTDANGNATTATAVVSVGDGANIAVGTTGAASVTGAHSVTGAVVATDQYGDKMTYQEVGSGPAHGTVTVNADGSYTYTATSASYTGNDSFQVQVSDGHGGTAIKTVTIADHGENAPSFVQDSLGSLSHQVDSTVTVTAGTSKSHGGSHGGTVVNVSGTYIDDKNDNNLTIVGSGQGDHITANGNNDVIYAGNEATGHIQAQLHIQATSPDEAAGATMSYSVGGLPSGVSLVDVHGAALDPTHLTDAQISSGVFVSFPDSSIPPAFDLSVTANLHESNGDTLSMAGSALHVDASSMASGLGDTIVANGNNDAIHGGWGNDSITVAGNNVDIYGGGGNDTITVAGNNAYIETGSGSDTIAVTGNNAEISAGDGHNTITAVGNNETISVGNGSDTISATGNNEDISAGNGSNSITLSGHNDDVTVGTGSNTITFSGTGNSSGGTVHLAGGTDTVYAGGSVTIDHTSDIGTANANITVHNTDSSGSSDLMFDFGAGHDTVTGGSGSSWTDTLDLTQHNGAFSITVTDASGVSHTWTEAAGQHGTIDLTTATKDQQGNAFHDGHDLSGTATNTQGHTIDFHNIEKITF